MIWKDSNSNSTHLTQLGFSFGEMVDFLEMLGFEARDLNQAEYGYQDQYMGTRAEIAIYSAQEYQGRLQDVFERELKKKLLNL